MKKILKEWRKHLKEARFVPGETTPAQLRDDPALSGYRSGEKKTVDIPADYGEEVDAAAGEWAENPSLDGMKCEEFNKAMTDLKYHELKPGLAGSFGLRKEFGSDVWSSLLSLNRLARLAKNVADKHTQSKLAKQFLEKKGPFEDIPEEYHKAVKYEIRAEGEKTEEEFFGAPLKGERDESSKVFDSVQALVDSVLKHPLNKKVVVCWGQGQPDRDYRHHRDPDTGHSLAESHNPINQRLDRLNKKLLKELNK